MQKRSRKLSRKEKVALVVVAVAVVAGMGLRQWYLQQRESERAAFEQSQKEDFAMGETVQLDSVKEEGAVDGGSPLYASDVAYGAGFPWKGILEATVRTAALYDTPEEAGFGDKDLVQNGSSDGFLLVCEVTLKNINADPFKTSTGKSWFNISFIGPSGGPNYFDGTPPGANPSEGFSFDLAQGVEKTYRLGWLVDEEHMPTMLKLGAVDKYAVKLDIQDLRGGAAQ